MTRYRYIRVLITLFLFRLSVTTGFPIQEGIASFYADDFHGKRTASGEIYNMYTMTAAHRTLPLGTLVEVTNLENKKKVIVRINDRGPFKDDRIIDLSLLAAKKLNFVTPGTTKVSVRPLSAEWLMSTISPDKDSSAGHAALAGVAIQAEIPAKPTQTGATTKPALTAQDDSIAHVYTIQIAAFQNPSAAFEFFQSTQLLLKNVFINGPVGAYNLFKIQTGSFFAYEEARAYLKIIHNFGYQEAFIASVSGN